MNIVIIRDDGDKQGPVISDNMLTTNAAGIERGRVEIDTNLYSRNIVETEVLDIQFVQNGSFVLVKDASLVDEVAMVTGVSASYSSESGTAVKVSTERVIL